jgi:hypothetical protein
MTVNMIPVGSQFVFHGPYDQFADRKGQTATVVAHITEDGPMYTIRFGDGFETEAWPEEVEDLGY